jgi:hypothetical protein
MPYSNAKRDIFHAIGLNAVSYFMKAVKADVQLTSPHHVINKNEIVVNVY